LPSIRRFHHPIFGEIPLHNGFYQVVRYGQMFLAATTATLPDLDQSTCRKTGSCGGSPSGVIIAMGNPEIPERNGGKNRL